MGSGLEGNRDIVGSRNSPIYPCIGYQLHGMDSLSRGQPLKSIGQFCHHTNWEDMKHTQLLKTILTPFKIHWLSHQCCLWLECHDSRLWTLWLGKSRRARDWLPHPPTLPQSGLPLGTEVTPCVLQRLSAHPQCSTGHKIQGERLHPGGPLWGLTTTWHRTHDLLTSQAQKKFSWFINLE